MSSKIIAKSRLSVDGKDFRKLFSASLSQQAIVVDESEDSNKITATRRLSVEGMDFQKLNSSLSQVIDEPESTVSNRVAGMDFRKLSTSLSQVKVADESKESNKITATRRLSVEGMDFRKLKTSLSHVVEEDDDDTGDGLKPSGSIYQIPTADEKRLPVVVTSSTTDNDDKPRTADFLSGSMSFKNMDYKSLNASLSRVNDAHHDVSTERKLLIQVQEINPSGKIVEKGFVTRDLYNYIVDLISVNFVESDLHTNTDAENDAHILRPMKGSYAAMRRPLELSKPQSKSNNNLQSMLSNREQNWSAQRPQPTTQQAEKMKKHGQPPLWDTRPSSGKYVTTSHHSHPNGHAQLPLRLRDLHRLDPYLILQVDGNNEGDGWDVADDNVQFILVRRGCILFAYGHIRAVILPNLLLLLHRFDKQPTAHYRRRLRSILQRISLDDTAGMHAVLRCISLHCIASVLINMNPPFRG